MPSSMRDPKSLSDWIELDYFRRERRLKRVWRALVWATLLLTPLLLAYTFLPVSHWVYQAGPVSTAHGMFNNDCAKCHTESLRSVSRVLPWNTNVHAVTDEACVRCHDGPPHHAGAPADQMLPDPNCASCHQEHRGRKVLARVPDAHCLSCHADLKGRLAARGLETQFRDVQGFVPGRHPRFAVIRNKDEDVAQVRFNHAHHLGLNFEEIQKQREGQPDTWREVLGGRDKLDCKDCHSPDANRRYMLPINYDSHCAKCHPLTVALQGKFTGEAEKAAREFAKAPAPHVLPEEVQATLRNRLTRFVQSHPEVLRPAAGEPLLPPRPRSAVTEKEWDWVSGQLRRLEGQLFSKQVCGNCHDTNWAPPPDQPAWLPTIPKTGIPPTWYKHAVFNHDSHRTVGCRECHSWRDGEDKLRPVEESRETKHVLLPDVDVCMRCHNQQQEVRSDCVHCHKFHHREKERWGRDLTIEELTGRWSGKRPEHGKGKE